MHMDIHGLIQSCAPDVHPATLRAIVHVESGGNPFAIGVVRGQLERQPRNVAEAVATAKDLDARGIDYSVGLSQINRRNWARLGLDAASAFDPCVNLRAGAAILRDCFRRAKTRLPTEQAALRGALSCYYSGNFATGFRRDIPGQPPYVDRVLAAAGIAGATKTAGNGSSAVPAATPSQRSGSDVSLHVFAEHLPVDDLQVFR